MVARSPPEAADSEARGLLGRAERTPWGWLPLAASTTTLVCCAAPILLVSLGLGAVSAALFSAVPALVVLAAHKGWLFAGAGALIAASGWMLFRPGRACPADPQLAVKCEAARRWNMRLFAASVALWLIGFAAAYLSLPLLRLYEATLAM